MVGSSGKEEGRHSLGSPGCAASPGQPGSPPRARQGRVSIPRQSKVDKMWSLFTVEYYTVIKKEQSSDTWDNVSLKSLH